MGNEITGSDQTATRLLEIMQVIIWLRLREYVGLGFF